MPIAEDGTFVPDSFYAKTAMPGAKARELQAATRLFADSTSEKVIEGNRQITLTVTTVQPGAARDGNAIITVTWRGRPTVCAGYASSYTPVVGHRVVCDLIDDQLIVAFRVIGNP